MANVKLKNVSERVFIIGNGDEEPTRLEPGKTATVGSARADDLMEMYPGELVDTAKVSTDETAAPVVGNATPEEIDAMNVKDLKAYLDAKGLKYAAATPKADLVKLAKGETAPLAPTEPTIAPTDLSTVAPDADLVEGTVYTDANGTYVGTLKDGKVGLFPVEQLTADEKAELVEAGKLAA